MMINKFIDKKFREIYFLIFYFLSIYMHGTDMLTTCILLYNGGIEINPLPSYLISNFGIPLTIIMGWFIGVFFYGLITAWFLRISPKYPKTAYICTIFVSVIKFIVCINNLWWLTYVI